MVANNGFAGTCFTCGEVGLRSSNQFDHERHQCRHHMRRYVARVKGHHADRRQGYRCVEHRQDHESARQECASHEADFYGRGRQGGDKRRVHFSDDDIDDLRQARAAIDIEYHRRDHFNHAKSSTNEEQFDRAASAIVAAHHVGDKLHLRTVMVDYGATQHMFTICLSPTNSNLSYPRRLCSAARTKEF
jgi:hypothetical protein